MEARLWRFPAFGEVPAAAVAGSTVSDAVSLIVVGVTVDGKDADSALVCREEARLRRVPVTDWPAVIEVPNLVDAFD